MSLDDRVRDPYTFSDRYSGADGFFNVGQKRYEAAMQHIWETKARELWR